MKKQLLIVLGLAYLLSSCNIIPDVPVTQKLSTNELARAIKKDTSFTSFYQNIRKVDTMDDIKKAQFNDVTYRRLYKYVNFLKDTTYWNPLIDTWKTEWTNKFGAYSNKADSTINYWKEYFEENSMDKYVKIELAKINKEYYDYIGELKEVHLGFRLTPLQGSIQQIRFNYSYKAKINGEEYLEKHNCISTSPISSSTIRYWEVDYSDKEDFAGKTVESFLRDYDLKIETTAIRKDGVNINIEDLNVPEEVSDYFAYGENDNVMRDYYKDKIIKELIFKDYLRQWEYIITKAEEIQEKEDNLCFNFLNELNK